MGKSLAFAEQSAHETGIIERKINGLDTDELLSGFMREAEFE